MLRPYGCSHSTTRLASSTARSPLCCVPPSPRWPAALLRLSPQQLPLPLLLPWFLAPWHDSALPQPCLLALRHFGRSAAALPAGTSCCSPPHPLPAAPSAGHVFFPHAERRFDGFRWPAIWESLPHRRFDLFRHPPPLPQSVSLPPRAPPGKTAPRRTSRSYPSASPPASSARPPRRPVPAATRPPSETSSGCDNGDEQTSAVRSE